MIEENFKLSLKNELLKNSLLGFTYNEITNIIDNMKISYSDSFDPKVKLTNSSNLVTEEMIEKKFKKIRSIVPFCIEYETWWVNFYTEPEQKRDDFIIIRDEGNGWFSILSELNSYDLKF